jgi:eukaryotic-like serine/threonine-protein kinase
MKQEAHDITDVGQIIDGQRRIRVLHSLADIAAGTGVFATTVNQDSFGKSEIVAVLSRTSLFGIRRPKDESVESFAEALAEIVKEEPGNIISVATRVIDARP